jgi:murein L,D-transpeptidase YafK
MSRVASCAALILAALGTVAATAGQQADRIVIRKAAREMVLLSHGNVLRSYKVALGKNPVGPKTRQGDMRTPEGLYTIDGRYAKSQYHRALHISYQNAAQRAQARKLGVDPGGDIMIHGLPNGQGYIGKAHLQSDWTWGCIAVTDEEIEEIWDLVPNGTPVEIKP